MLKIDLLSTVQCHSSAIAALAPVNRGGVFYSLGRNEELFRHIGPAEEPCMLRFKDTHIQPHGYDTGIDISPDGKLAYIARSDKYHPGVRFVNLKPYFEPAWHNRRGGEGEVHLHSFGCTEHHVDRVACHPCGSIISFVSRDIRTLEITAHFRDLADWGRTRTVVPGGDGGSLSFSPDGRLFAVPGYTRADGACIHLRDMHGDIAARVPQSSGASSISFTPTGRWLIFGTGDILRGWNVATGASVSVDTGSSINHLVITADSHWCLTCHQDTTIRLWEMGSEFSLVTRYVGDTAVRMLSGVRADGRFAGLCGANTIGWFGISGFLPRPSWVTGGRIWSYRPRVSDNDHWNSKVKLTGYEGDTPKQSRGACGWCGAMIEMPTESRKAIDEMRLGWKRFPTIDLSPEHWTDSRLAAQCTACGNRVQFNPFDIGHAELPAGRAAESANQPGSRKESADAGPTSVPEKQFPIPRPRRLCGLPLMCDDEEFERYREELRAWEAKKKAWEEKNGVSGRQDRDR